MRGGIRGNPFLSAIMIVIAMAVVAQPFEAVHAEEFVTFEGTLTANGHRKDLAFIEGRAVFTFALEGHVNLSTKIGETGDFWADWIGLWDTKTGGTVRCVWDDLHGHKIYVVLTGSQMKKGARLTGEFVGGTGIFKGIQGSFAFSWTSVVFQPEGKVIAGYAKDIKGSYRIP